MRSRRRSGGYSLIQAAILGLALVAIMGLALDTAYVTLYEHQLQNAADAAAFSGAFYVRTSQSAAMIIQGTPDINNTGVLYVPAAHVDIAGNPSAVGSMLVCDTIAIQGNGTCVINYNGLFPSQGNSIFLVK